MIRGMNRRVICVCLAVAATATNASAKPDWLLLDKEKVHALIRESAAKIEEKYKGKCPEADGMVQQVEEALAASEPEKPDKSDRQRMLAAKLKLFDGEVKFSSGFLYLTGLVFDNSEEGYTQRYQERETSTTTGAAEVWRWLEMKDAARHLKWEGKKEMCIQRAQGAARALVSREPKNAEAHTLLGLTLEWSNEKMAELRTALKLDQGQLLAQCEILDRRITQALETVALREETSLEEKPKTLVRTMHARALTEEETLAYGRLAEGLQKEVLKLRTLAQERRDLRAYFQTMYLELEIKMQHEQTKVAATRGEEEDFETFEARWNSQMTPCMFSMFGDEEQMKSLLKLADGNAEAMGAALLLSVLADVLRNNDTRIQASENRVETIRRGTDRLMEMARAEDSVEAARAAEGAFLTDLVQHMQPETKPERVDMLLRAIQLDPFRSRTQNLLVLLCSGAVSKDWDPQGMAAVRRMLLVLQPGVYAQRSWAESAATLLHDWPEAQRQLDACLKESPDDVVLMCQKASTFLLESQSKAAQKKANFYYDRMGSLMEKQMPELSQADLGFLARNEILHLLICGKNNEAREGLATAREQHLLEEKECKKLEKLLP